MVRLVLVYVASFGRRSAELHHSRAVRLREHADQPVKMSVNKAIEISKIFKILSSPLMDPSFEILWFGTAGIDWSPLFSELTDLPPEVVVGQPLHLVRRSINAGLRHKTLPANAAFVDDAVATFQFGVGLLLKGGSKVEVIPAILAGVTPAASKDHLALMDRNWLSTATFTGSCSSNHLKSVMTCVPSGLFSTWPPRNSESTALIATEEDKKKQSPISP
jgi:hypothetical protein